MPDFSIQVDNYHIGKVNIEAAAVRGSGGRTLPLLEIPAIWTMQSVQSRTDDAAGPRLTRHYTLISVWGDVAAGQQNQERAFAHVQSPPLLVSTLRSHESYEYIKVQLDAERLHALEAARDGDMHISARLTTLVAKHLPVPTSPEPDLREEPPIVSLTTGRLEFRFSIPRSVWVERVLPHVGYGSSWLVEIARPSLTGDSLSRSTTHLATAMAHYTNGLYDLCVAECRKAIEIIPKSTKLKGLPQKPSFKDRTAAYVEQHLSGVLDKAKRAAVSEMAGTLWALTSKPHHASHTTFSRIDADCVMQLTTTLVSYVGRLLESGR
ncbi:MAG TPA: hypothetical protein VMH22_02325 [bacterium]|nr:hypothetical protein [bacterium]